MKARTLSKDTMTAAGDAAADRLPDGSNLVLVVIEPSGTASYISSCPPRFSIEILEYVLGQMRRAAAAESN